MNRLKLLRPASFRGVRFEVDASGKEAGRRITTHKFPGQDAPYHEDMGKDVTAFSIDCWINGDDFIQRAAALDAALDQAGPGTLIHPVLGELQVIALKYSRRDSTRAVGDVDYTISFEIYGGPVFPATIGNTSFELGNSAAAFMTSLSSGFRNTFRMSGIPDFITGDSAMRFSSLTGNLQSILTTTGLDRFFPGDMPVWGSSVGTLADSIVDLFDTLGGLSKKKSASMIGTTIMPAAPAPALPLSKALTNASAFSAGSEALSGNSIRITNARALDNMFQAASLAAAATSAKNAVYESREEALQFRDTFSSRMETVTNKLAAAGWEESWGAGVQVTAALVRDINDRVGRLPRTVSVETRAVRPSLDLANRLYGDDPAKIFSAAGDIAVRNRVRHPGMIPARVLEVLIDAGK